jgi:peptidoglycan/xylan/chitin deacetylase (PgdA/CDA1 family)
VSIRPAALVTGVGLAVAAYWTRMSPYSQWLGAFPFRAATRDTVIALTFDDGPNEPFTSQIADFLAEVGVRATFFQVGRCVEQFPEVTRRLVREQHVVGNHSYSHHPLRCLRPAEQRRETATTQQVLAGTLGQVPALYRPPWLYRTRSLMTTLHSRGLRPVSGVFCHPLEPFQPSAERIARRALARARPGAIVIFHDGVESRGGNRASTVQAAKIFVRTLLEQGYRFVTVDELLQVPAWQPG